jgi:hypothetical protein
VPTGVVGPEHLTSTKSKQPPVQGGCCFITHGSFRLLMATTIVDALDKCVDLDSLWAPKFPAVELLSVAAATVWDSALASGRLERVARAPRAQLEETPDRRRNCYLHRKITAPCEHARVAGSVAGVDQAEGPAFFLEVSPGSIRFRRHDLNRSAKRHEQEQPRHAKLIRQAVGWLNADAQRGAEQVLADSGLIDQAQVSEPGCDPLSPGAGRSRITDWSAKSRANMTYRLLTLDYSLLYRPGRRPAMCTLTLPANWLEIAKTGKDFKMLVARFQEAYFRAWGERLVGVWKLEFQERGAPHLHFLTAPPVGLSKSGRTWRDWFAEAWASAIGVRDLEREKVIAVHRHPTASADYAEGMRMTDPKRVAVYFTKHGLLANKEYQHRVPLAWQDPGAGPGRFWGVWGLDVHTRYAELTYDQAVYLARVARKISASHKGIRVATVQRVNTRTGLVKTRKLKRRVKRLRGTWGFLAVNDGAAFAFMLADTLRT